MAALDTFEWYIGTTAKNPTPDVQKYISEQRQALNALRSEDERQRFVETIMRDFPSLIIANKKTSTR
jgi:hypothetical protein